jgi:acylglycerol lipase
MATANEPPAEWTLREAGGPLLFVRSWLPPSSARAAIVVVHGLAEHGGRYAATAASLVKAGFAVHAVDYRGHGESEGARVHVDSVGEYVADVREGLDAVRRRHPGLPVFLLGHSQGGLIVLKLALDDPAGLAGIVVTSPFLAVHPRSRPSAFTRAGAALLRHVAPRLPLHTRIDVSVLSRDPSVGEAYARDPLVSGKASAGWLAAITRAQREVMAAAPSLRVPALVMASGEDLLVDPEVARRFALAAPPEHVEFVWWDGYYHEMLNDLGREQVWARIIAWLAQHSGVT